MNKYLHVDTTKEGHLIISVKLYWLSDEKDTYFVW